MARTQQDFPPSPAGQAPLLSASPALAHILLVEDDASSAFSVRRSLESRGFRVTVAPDGLQALEKHDDDPADLVILDLRLPVLDGRAVALDLRSRSLGLPILMVSSHMSDLGSSLATETLVKPVDCRVLCERVLTLLHRAGKLTSN